MALKDDAVSVAQELHVLAERANAVARLIPSPEQLDAQAKIKLPWSKERLGALIHRTIENNTDPENIDADYLTNSILGAILHDAGPHLVDNGEVHDPELPEFALTPTPTGVKIGRRDRNGKQLRSGDRVRVFGSERYGNPTGVVCGPGLDHGDGKERVLITLDHGQDDLYTPSTGRVERIERVRDRKANKAINGAADALHAERKTNGHAEPIVVELFRSGPMRVGVIVPADHPLAREAS